MLAIPKRRFAASKVLAALAESFPLTALNVLEVLPVEGRPGLPLRPVFASRKPGQGLIPLAARWGNAQSAISSGERAFKEVLSIFRPSK
jgi:hypothetical protein